MLNLFSPIYLIGIIFVLAILIAFILKDTNLALIIGLPFLLYPFSLFNHNLAFLALGSIISGFILGNLLSISWTQFYRQKTKSDHAALRKLLFSNIKLFVLGTALGVPLFFILGADQAAFFTDTIKISIVKMLANLIPLFILLIFLIFEVDFLISSFLSIVVQIVLTLYFKLYSDISIYNAIDFTLFYIDPLIAQGVNVFLLSICSAIVDSLFYLIFLSWIKIIGWMMTDSSKKEKLFRNFIISAANRNHDYRLIFYKVSLFDFILNINSRKEYYDDLIITNFDSNDLNNRVISSMALLNLWQQIISLLTPLSLSLLWGLFLENNIFATSMLTQYLNFLKSCWVLYFYLLLIVIFTYFAKLQDWFFSNWTTMFKVKPKITPEKVITKTKFSFKNPFKIKKKNPKYLKKVNKKI